MASLAAQRGAVAVLVERLLPLAIPQCIVPDTRRAYGIISQTLMNHPSDDLIVVAITGSYGKTATQQLTASVLKNHGFHIGWYGPSGRHDGVHCMPTPTTDPTSAQWAGWLGQVRNNGCTHAVLEVSSQALAEYRTCGIGVDIAVLTNLGREHLDVHQSVHAYRQVKRRLFDQLKRSGVAVINADDPACAAIAATLECPVITFATTRPADVRGQMIERHTGGQTFLIEWADQCIAVHTALVADFHVEYCLAAACAGLLLNVPIERIVRGLERVSHISHSLERIECGQPFTVLVDSARSAASLNRTLKSVMSTTTNRLICLFSGCTDYPAAANAQLGRVVERLADVCVLTGQSPTGQGNWRIAHEVLDGFDRPAVCHVLPNRERAIVWALQQAQLGDTIVITGSRPRDITRRKRQIDDLAVARRYLYATAPSGIWSVTPS